ncbi:MAG: helix-turn-helix transcriptional regulator [Firmicutes bacterium]|nr:helix-turn-helix transcriptional regulator [Bacillota bacterium]
MELTQRQQKIMAIVQAHEPITGERIAELLCLTRAALRPDLTLLTMAGLLYARPHVGYFLAPAAPLEPCAGLRQVVIASVQGQPVVVAEKTSVHDAILALFVQDVGSLCVVREDALLVGVVSRKDLLKVAIGQSDLHQVPVSMVMTRMPNVATVTPEDSLLDAADRLVTAEVDTLPVVTWQDDGPHVVGRVTKTTVTRWLVEQCGPQDTATRDNRREDERLGH